MKFKYLLLLFLFAPSFSWAQDFYKSGFFVIKGQAKNFKDPVLDFGMTTYLGNISKSVIVKSDGSFEQQFPIQNRQDIYFYLNHDAILFNVSDKDTLFMEWDQADFKNTFSIKGNNNIRTRELQIQMKLFNGMSMSMYNLQQQLYENNNKLTPEKKYNLINDAFNRNAQEFFDSTRFFSKNDKHLITSLYFWYSKLLLMQHLIPKYKLNFTFDSIRNYPSIDIPGIQACSFCDYTLLSDNWFIAIPEYRDFIYDYIRFYKPFNSYSGDAVNNQKKFNPTLDEYYLAQANIFYIDIKDWVITKSIMDGFNNYSFGDVENVYKQFLNTCETPYLKDTLQKYYTAIKRLKPGNPAPGFSLKNEEGKTVSLSNFKGKVVYIDFWGVGCGPCIYDIENHVPDLHKRYKDKEVVFINICVDSNEKEWKNALAKYQSDGINLIAEGWAKNPVCKMYNISSIPHYILIDKNGKIANNNAPRAYELNDKSDNNPIDQLLK